MCQSGERLPGKRRGRSSARPAASRKRAAKSGVSESRATTRSCARSGSGRQTRPAAARPPRGSARRCRRRSRGRRSRDRCARAPSRRSPSPTARAPAAERREHAHAPVAHLVEVALDDDRAVVGHRARRRVLIGEVLEQVARGALVEVVLLDEPARAFRRIGRAQRPRERADRATELERTRRGLALPERHLPRDARRGRDEHAVVRDLLDAPRRRAEHERLALARLEHHLLVELADAALARLRADEEHAVQAAVRDRAAAGERDACRALARAQAVRDAVPHDARPQLRELVGREASRQHVEDAFEDRPREIGERRGAAHDALEIVDGPRLDRDHRDDLLREDVEWIARVARSARPRRRACAR